MGELTTLPQTLYSAGGLDKLLPLALSAPLLHVQCPIPEIKTIVCIATVLNTMRQRITAIAQTMIFHKTARYFVENRYNNTNKQALLQRSRAAYAWSIA